MKTISINQGFKFYDRFKIQNEMKKEDKLKILFSIYLEISKVENKLNNTIISKENLKTLKFYNEVLMVLKKLAKNLIESYDLGGKKYD